MNVDELVKFGGRQTAKRTNPIRTKKSDKTVKTYSVAAGKLAFIREGKERYPIGSKDKHGFKQHAFLGPAPWQIFKGQEQLVFKVFDDKFPALLEHEIEYRLGRL
jgi:hypothetical protein